MQFGMNPRGMLVARADFLVRTARGPPPLLLRIDVEQMAGAEEAAWRVAQAVRARPPCVTPFVDVTVLERTAERTPENEQ